MLGLFIEGNCKQGEGELGFPQKFAVASYVEAASHFH